MVRAKEKQRKSFTVEQANATLPLVRAIVRDLTALAVDLRDRHERLRHAPEGASVSPEHEEEMAQARAALENDLERLGGFEQELAELGVELKDYFLGLVDFPSLLDGRPVYLCWKAGEDSVTHWHELDAGFAGRKPLEAALSPSRPLSHEGDRGSKTTVADGTP
jgi:hypothetical protein